MFIEWKTQYRIKKYIKLSYFFTNSFHCNLAVIGFVNNLNEESVRSNFIFLLHVTGFTKALNEVFSESSMDVNNAY